MNSADITPAFAAETFSLTPDPRRLFLSRCHAEALAGLKLGLEYRRGLMVVVAEVGMGKTTIAYSHLAMVGERVRTAYIANTRLPFDALLGHALDDFGVPCPQRDRASLLTALKAFLLDCAERDEIAVLVVDEAQGLDDETFENLRLLSNVETYVQKLLQIVLLGQPELDSRLRDRRLRQIAERVGVRVNINPLDRPESERYVAHRLERAGGSLAMFSTPALRFIVKRTRGVPRRMNIVCHNALLLAYAAGASQVTLSMAREAVRELVGGTLRRLPWRWSPKAAAAEARGRIKRSWTAAAAIVAVAGVAVATGLVRPASTPSATRAATVPPVAAAVTPSAGGAGEAPAVATVPASPEPDPGTPASAPGAVGRADAAPEADAVADSPASGTRRITVKRGTTLLAIAREVYGTDSADVVRQIVRANPGVTNPNVIVAGSTIVIPPLESAEAARSDR